MKLTGLDAAVVPEGKVVGYLLSPTHRAGRGKAAFFRRFGFSAEKWQELVAALVRHAAEHDVKTTEESRFGTKYVIEGALNTPDGRNPTLRAVWFLGRKEAAPRLVTAYACE